MLWPSWGLHSRLYASTSTSSPTVLLLDDIELATNEMAKLKGQAQVVQMQAKSRREFIEEVKGLSNLKAIYRHFGGARSIKVGR